ncbi:Collagen-like protein 2 family protein [Capnocytophaga gingivalis ATCC 33624]|uniref:collagen-like protein n=1 Tax=Capnocytophaga gingivalis TaxID=1017 RepID=UPI00019FA540|nr:collagen-like protein [Capnocytophaga gingivalis]EEK15548.1 Collagen-like protein 2 family protein [Capnocytophaga gingivalis ATCC 33624]
MKKYLLPLLALSFSAIHCTKENEKIVVQEKVTQGSMILSGEGVPSAEKGQTGDYYLDLSSSALYGPKTKDGWGNSVLNLKGLKGDKGDKGDNGTNGQNGQLGQNGQPGLTPHIGENGNWWVGNTDLGVKAQGNPGTNGQDGQPGRDGQPGQPGRDGQNGQPGRDGQNGETPRIGDNGNWWIGNEDTGKPARGAQGPQGNPGTNGQNGQPGRDGQNGETPRIGDNGNWWIGNEDTGKPARGAQGPQGNPGTNGQNGQPGRDGQNGHTPHIGKNGNWWVGDQDTGKPARGAQGPQGSQGNPGQQGAQGNPGRDGKPGADGSKILAGNGTPQASDGNIGDYFIDKTAKIFYGPKTASGWPTTGISLTGNPVVTEDYQLSPDGKTLVKWLNKKARYIDMNTDPKLSEVEKIADNAFDEMGADNELSTIIVGDKVTELGKFTFSKCRNLRRIELPDGLTTIGKGAFDACSNLQYINIPETVTNLGEQAFTNCTKLKTITIPKGISSFGKRTFFGCSALRTLILENPVGFEINKANMQNAFQGVTLNVIYVPYGSADDYKNKNKSSYSNYQNIIKSIVIQ